ncbi:sensor histidine kinase [Brachybacterium phenoliresistens]|uniref:sensor histidine kinase n=1 Tax=Brachybacterium phenoliresistens TaxID=396014 RepID=UPI0031E0816A
MRGSRPGGRVAWLMAGAAICTAAALLVALFVPPELRVRGFAPMVLGSALLGGLVGLVPGVREIEVAAARTMLGVEEDLVVPARPSPAHRLRGIAFVQVHLLSGAVLAAGLTMALPASTVVIVDVLRGGAGSFLPLPADPLGRAAAGIGAGLLAVLVLVIWWPLGALAARLAPVLLGPTAQDRLALALARSAQEAARTRIARDLHDGIGHALTVVSLQAAAGRHVITRDPASAEEALARIEDTARRALEELDGMLAALREDAPSGGAEPSGQHRRRLEAVLAEHRRAGMDLHAQVDVPPDLPAVQGEHLVRILAELLANAHRHGGPGPVELRLGPVGSVLHLEVSNPLADAADAADAGPAAADRVPRRGGHGLPGLSERCALFGGELEAGAEAGRWRARVRLPILQEEP